MWEDKQIINAIGIERGVCQNGLQFYNLIGKTIDGLDVVMTYAIKPHHQSTIEKSFSRLFPVRAPWDVANNVSVLPEIGAEKPVEAPTQLELPLNEGDVNGTPQ